MPTRAMPETGNNLIASHRPDWVSILTADERALLITASAPEWLDPMLATLTHKRFSDPAWIYECKLDGIRALGFRNDNELHLYSRNRIDMTQDFPAIAERLMAQPCTDYVIDGEIVAFDENNVSSFTRLQQRRMHLAGEKQTAKAIYYYAFDVLHMDGYNLDQLPLRTRKKLLKAVFVYQDRLRYCAHRNTDGEKYFAEACKKGWEGLIAKRADGPYRHRRSTDWLKFKCTKRQELVIGGYTPPRKGRIGFGALLVGYFDNGKLRYAGKVGTGFSDQFLSEFKRTMDNSRVANSPFADDIREAGATWIEPVHVGEFAFTEWTTHGKLRHPSFLGLRFDKSAHDVVREQDA